MRVAASVIGFSVTLHSPSFAQPFDFQDAITSALNWHYRWLEPIPTETNSIECSVAAFEEHSFGFCEPGLPSMKLSMTLVNPEKGSPRVTHLWPEFHSFERALDLFRIKGRSLGPVQKLSIAVRDLARCTIDWKLTAQAPSVVSNQEMRTELLNSGRTFRYPFICEGDPLYLLYSLTGERINWIWLYEVIGDQFELRWSFDPGTTQGRKIPALAIENLGKKELWYKVEGATNKE